MRPPVALCMRWCVSGVKGAPRVGRRGLPRPPCRCGPAADRTPALQFGGTSLHTASERGHPAVVQTLLDHGADVAARDNVGAAGGRARECIAREDALDPMS